MSVNYSAPDLTRQPPRSPRLRLGGYVLRGISKSPHEIIIEGFLDAADECTHCVCPQTTIQTVYMSSSTRRFLTDFHMRVPLDFADAVARAAGKRLTSRSDYIRGAVLDRLRADEIDVNDGRDDRHPISDTGVAA